VRTKPPRRKLLSFFPLLPFYFEHLSCSRTRGATTIKKNLMHLATFNACKIWYTRETKRNRGRCFTKCIFIVRCSALIVYIMCYISFALFNSRVKSKTPKGSFHNWYHTESYKLLATQSKRDAYFVYRRKKNFGAWYSAFIQFFKAWLLWSLYKDLWN